MPASRVKTEKSELLTWIKESKSKCSDIPIFAIL